MIEQKRNKKGFGHGDGYYGRKRRTRKQKQRTKEIVSTQRRKKEKDQIALNTVYGGEIPQQRVDQAFAAGGSRPMHQGTTSQIDPMTGMPLQGNAPQMGNFGGAMNQSNVPNYNSDMNMGAMAQARKEYSEEINTRPMSSQQLKKYNSAVDSYKDSTKKWISGKGPEPKVPDYTSFKLTDDEKKKYNVNIDQNRMARDVKNLKPSETYSAYKDFKGNMKQGTIDDSTFTADSTNFKQGYNPKYKLDMNRSYDYNKAKNPKAVEFTERMTKDNLKP